MDTRLQEYLEKIDHYLKPMPAVDRADIIKEIQSDMLELQAHGGLSPEQVAERLGNPKELARAYLGEALSQPKGAGAKRFFALLAFYSLAGLSGMVILPLTGITAVAFIFSGIFAPICGAAKLAASLFGSDLPFIMFQFGSYIAPPLPAFFLSLIMGAILLALGAGLWKLTIAYIRLVSRKSQTLSHSL